MKTTPVTENLTQLTRLHLVNAFLVREDDGFTSTTLDAGVWIVAFQLFKDAPMRD